VVTSEQNPADNASRGLTADTLLNKLRWINGPEFLWKSENYWPSQPTITHIICDDDPEVKLTMQVFFITNSSLGIIKRFSSWVDCERSLLSAGLDFRA
jgi:hypothetical protein